MHQHSGTQYEPSKPTTYHSRSSMHSSCSTFPLSSSMMLGKNQVITPTGPLTGPLSTTEYDKLRLGFGCRLSMTSFRPTLNISSKQHPKHPPGKQDAQGLCTNLSLGAGAWPSEPYRKTAVPLHHKTPLTKFPANSFAHQSQLKSRTSSSLPQPRPDAHATNNLHAKSPTERFPIASANSDLLPTRGAPKHATRTLPPYSRHPMAFRLHDSGLWLGRRAPYHNTLPTFGSLDRSNHSARSLALESDPSPFSKCFLNLPLVSYLTSPKLTSSALLDPTNMVPSWNVELTAWSITYGQWRLRHPTNSS